MDFHQATKNLPLPRAAKNRVQLYLSKRTKEQIKKLLEEMDDTIADTLRGIHRGYQGIILPKEVVEPEKREALQKAIFLKAIRDFTQTYQDSLLMQKKL